MESGRQGLVDWDWVLSPRFSATRVRTSVAAALSRFQCTRPMRTCSLQLIGGDGGSKREGGRAGVGGEALCAES